MESHARRQVWLKTEPLGLNSLSLNSLSFNSLNLEGLIHGVDEDFEPVAKFIGSG
jgi:hypothetical protein